MSSDPRVSLRGLRTFCVADDPEFAICWLGSKAEGILVPCHLSRILREKARGSGCSSIAVLAVILIADYGGVPDESVSHEGHHDHHKHEIGMANSAVYFVKEKGGTSGHRYL